ncbi:MAG: DUF3179 domain-containing protein [Litoreibacter sp.]|nr:DUF3179 domain-containing protein [Litoreibacter sp.]
MLIAVALTTTAYAQDFSNPFMSAQWPKTDFSKTTVDLDSIRSGGPGKDGIMAVWEPELISVDSETRLSPREPVIALEMEGEPPRAYPIRYFMVHEIVNDTMGGVPVAVTFCPLCNSAMVFDRRVKQEVRTFGVSGNLRNSDMVMYDRETESWWQQAIGAGIVGAHAGDTLEQLPSWMESWEAFAARNPDGLVLDAPRKRFDYGFNPYVRYDSSKRPFLYDGALPPDGIDPMERVVRVGNDAWPLTRLRAEQEVVENGVRLSWVGEQASALDTRNIARGKTVGSIRVRDAESGADIPHDLMFAFAFQAFFPDGIWRQ